MRQNLTRSSASYAQRPTSLKATQMDPGFSNKNHYSPFDQIVSADGGYSLSSAALLAIPVNMQVDVIAAQIRILFAEAVISSWLDCYNTNHQGGSLASYNTGFWDDGSSRLDGTLIHSPLCKGVRGIGVLDNDATRLTMEEYRKASRRPSNRDWRARRRGIGLQYSTGDRVEALIIPIEARDMASHEHTFNLQPHRLQTDDAIHSTSSTHIPPSRAGPVRTATRRIKQLPDQELGINRFCTSCTYRRSDSTIFLGPRALENSTLEREVGRYDKMNTTRYETRLQSRARARAIGIDFGIY
jgi:hypothetical protein